MRARLQATLTVAIGAALLAPGAAQAVPKPGVDPFYAYGGATPLAEIAPGTILATRTSSYHLAGLRTPIKTVQLLYRSTGQIGQPTTNVTSVLLPPAKVGPAKLISYGSFYDSLNPDDEPSYAISGGVTPGGLVSTVEAAFILPFLLKGYTVTVPDTQGQQANFAAGPEYGLNTIDSLRATFSSPAVGLPATTKAGLIGYSGGAIATEWAAELAPSYAPDVDRRLVGAAFGGVLVSPAHNLHYVEGSAIWAGVAPMAIVGAARAFQIDLTPYLSPYGLHVYRAMKRASIAQVLGAYPGLTWARLAKPQYATPEDVPLYVHVVNQLIMGTGGTPTVPLFIGQGAKGELEGTPGNKPGIGRGDGVMIAGDVRTLARQYCGAGTDVLYRQYDAASHVGALTPWWSTAYAWMIRRFAGQAAPENCATIAPGNSLAPIPE